jgi:hypothetical protein
MPGKASRRKGSSWEREVAKIFRERLGIPTIKRGLGQARSASEVADVDGVPRLWVEAKNQKRVNLRAALEQATHAITKSKSSKMAIAVAKEDHKKPMIAMYLDDFLDLVYPRTENADKPPEADGSEGNSR